MSFFDLRIPGLAMTVIAADGNDVETVAIDELRIGVAERYDIIVTPKEDITNTLFAEAIDRSGYARATLAPREGLEVPIPERRERALLTMDDMGMTHDDHATMNHGAKDPATMNHDAMNRGAMDHGAMNHDNRRPQSLQSTAADQPKGRAGAADRQRIFRHQAVIPIAL